MARRILLVEDQPDVRSLLHSALDTLRAPDIETFEAATGKQAVQEFARRPIDLLVLKDRLPDVPGIELMHGMRAGRPDLRVIMIMDAADRRKREEILNAGAAAVFQKPVPLGDFLDAVERTLGLTATIFPADETAVPEPRVSRISDLLANLRQDMPAEGALLINERGLVAARAGGLPDHSMEVSLISGLSAIFGAGLKVARSHGEDVLHQHWVYQGDKSDLILLPVNAQYALLLAGPRLAAFDDLPRSLRVLQAVAVELDKSLQGVKSTAETAPGAERPSPETHAGENELDDLLGAAGHPSLPAKEVDTFWAEAAASDSEIPSSPDTISFEEARKLGLTPDDRQR